MKSEKCKILFLKFIFWQYDILFSHFHVSLTKFAHYSSFRTTVVYTMGKRISGANILDPGAYPKHEREVKVQFCKVHGFHHLLGLQKEQRHIR